MQTYIYTYMVKHLIFFLYLIFYCYGSVLTLACTSTLSHTQRTDNQFTKY